MRIVAPVVGTLVPWWGRRRNLCRIPDYVEFNGRRRRCRRVEWASVSASRRRIRQSPTAFEACTKTEWRSSSDILHLALSIVATARCLLPKGPHNRETGWLDRNAARKRDSLPTRRRKTRRLCRIVECQRPMSCGLNVVIRHNPEFGIASPMPNAA
jgi:hypothetical protein